jgi:hypothetical protein
VLGRRIEKGACRLVGHLNLAALISLVHYVALKKAGVPVEMHLYAHGGHAFGLRRTELPITGWPELVEAWLRTIGMISEILAPNLRM